MGFRDWMLRNRQQVMQHLREGGTLQELVQYDPQTGSFQDPFSGQPVTASAEEMGNLERMVTGATGNNPRGPRGQLAEQQQDPAGMVGPTSTNQQNAGQYSTQPSYGPGTGGGSSSTTFQAGQAPADIDPQTVMSQLSKFNWQEDPELRSMMMGAYQSLMDKEGRESQWYKDEHGRALQSRSKLMDWADAVLGNGKYKGQSFNPDNPQAFAGIGADVADVANRLKDRMRELDESTLDPATKARMKEELQNQAYQEKGSVAQLQREKARGFLSEDMSQGRSVAQSSGAAAQAGGLSNQYAGMKSQAELAAMGLNAGQEQFGLSNALNRDQFNYSRYGDQRNFGYQQGRDQVSDSQWQQDYKLRQQQLQQQKPKSGFWGTLGSLVGVGLNFIPGIGPAASAGFGALSGAINRGNSSAYDASGGGARK